MTFSDQLNRYLEDLGCPANRLSKLTGIPAYTISKYRNGTRRPDKDSEIVTQLADGIRKAAEEKDVRSILDSDVAAALNDAIQFEAEDFDFETLIQHLRLLVKGFRVTLTEIAEGTNFSRSTLYSMWRGKSKLRDPDVFVDLLAQYIVNRFGDMNGQMKAAKLIGWPEQLFETKAAYLEAMTSWLSGEFVSDNALTEKTLHDIEEFDLNEYQTESKYEALSLSKMPIRLAKVKDYYGMGGLEAGIADFIRAATMSRSYKDIILYSDLPMDRLLLKGSAPKLWIDGLRMVLQRGIRVKVIHYVHRPTEEIMEGLRVWIPLLMSGQVQSLYAEHERNYFHNCILASGGGVLRGGCVEGDFDDAHFQLYTAAETVDREYRLAERLASLAQPLLQPYTQADKVQFEDFLRSEALVSGRRDALLSAPPIYTISDDLLGQILSRNRVSEKDAKKIRTHINTEKKRIAGICENNEIYVRLAHFTKREFKTSPVRLSLSRSMLAMDLLYTSEEYEQHIIETKVFARAHKNYHFFVNQDAIFRNVQIATVGESAALISRNKFPAMHFVLQQPRWVEAIAKLGECGEGK